MASLVSAGTEKHMLEMAKKSLVGKALARPDLVRQVIAKAKTKGILESFPSSDEPVGYSRAVGTILLRRWEKRVGKKS
ncbi:MAG: hypothetical protein DRJ69_00010 [Thermoprotei archaeon]|nr:MAG: hypothetical protein DRJ69_00010 [Thermoprotei archaeon]